MEAETADLFCTRCGHRIPSEEARFCSRCGGALHRRDEAASTRGVPPHPGEMGDVAQAHAPGMEQEDTLRPELLESEPRAGHPARPWDAPGGLLSRLIPTDPASGDMQPPAAAADAMESGATPVAAADDDSPDRPLPLATLLLDPEDDASVPEPARVPQPPRPTSMHTTYLLPPLFLRDAAEPDSASAQDVAEMPGPRPEQEGGIGNQTAREDVVLAGLAAAVESEAPAEDRPASEVDPDDILIVEPARISSRQAPDAPAGSASMLAGAGIVPVPRTNAAPDPAPDPASPVAAAPRPRSNGPWPVQMPLSEPGIDLDGCRLVRIGEGGGWLEIALAVDASLVCAVSALIWLDSAIGMELIVAARTADAGRFLSLSGPGSLCLGACPGGALAVLQLQAGDALDLARGARLSARGAGLVAERRAPRGGTPVTRFRAVRPTIAILEVPGVPYAVTLPPAGTLVVGAGILVAADADVLIAPIRQPLSAQRVFGPGSLLLRGEHPGCP